MPGTASAASAAPASTSAAADSSDFASFERYVLDLQDRILSEAEAIDGSGKAFVRDRWSRGSESAGYGITAVLEGGDLLEKAAANISIIHGQLSAQRAQAMSSRGRADIDPAGGQPYSAAAMSLVFHPAHPLVPTLRADVRLFQVAGSSWFGGGCDLTPSYLFDEDAAEFHAHWKAVCDRYAPPTAGGSKQQQQQQQVGEEAAAAAGRQQQQQQHTTGAGGGGGGGAYREYKEWCDRYFYIPCRKEHRGVGGIFFDDVCSAEAGFDAGAFVRDVGDNVLPSWRAIAARRRAEPFTQQQRDWQLLRRGRYLEFNLLYDRGVKFGLDGGRVESIMVSAPPLIAWRYNVEPTAGSEEERLVEALRSPREWA